jgi:predicted amidohydrolase YtcJ
MKRKSVILALMLISTSGVSFAEVTEQYQGMSVHNLCKSSDKIFHNAKFITMNDKQPIAQAVAVTNERITAVGLKDEILKYCKGGDTKLVDLNGATVSPGFIDTHSHFVPYGVLSYPSTTLNAGSMMVL